MRKKKPSKLRLSRETLRRVHNDRLAGAAGAVQCTSDQCSNNCTGNNCTQGPSQCICPMTDDTFGF